MQASHAIQSYSGNFFSVCTAAAGGIILGGVSVLAITLAVIEPRPHDAPIGSAVFDGQVHVVRSAPAQATVAAPDDAAVSPPVAFQSQSVRPVDVQRAQPPQVQTPAQVLENTWPDAPPRASRSVRDTHSAAQQRHPDSGDDDAGTLRTSSTRYDNWDSFFGFNSSDSSRN